MGGQALHNYMYQLCYRCSNIFLQNSELAEHFFIWSLSEILLSLFRISLKKFLFVTVTVSDCGGRKCSRWLSYRVPTSVEYSRFMWHRIHVHAFHAHSQNTVVHIVIIHMQLHALRPIDRLRNAELLCLQCDESGCTSLVNVAADSGNTPLHVAVNRGDATLVRELLNSPNVNVDSVNGECGDVTPLMLAAMHGLLCDTVP